MRLIGFKGEHPIQNPCGDDIRSESGIFYRRFKQWTDRNHFARVDHYKNDILPMITSTFPEDSMHKSTRQNCTHFAPYYYQAGKGDRYYDHTDASERYGFKLFERVKRGELDYSSLSEVIFMVMKQLGVNMTELDQYKDGHRALKGAESSYCQTESGNELIFTADASIFPHAPQLTSVSSLFPRFDDSQPEFACWYDCPMHHPHFVQELFRCFSLWQTQPSHHPRVLYVPKQQFWGKLGNLPYFDEKFPISRGILRTLVRSYNVTVTKSWDAGTPLKTQEMMEKDYTVSPFAMASREHATKWKHIFAPLGEEPIIRRKKERLKIAVVNRPEVRKLLNALDASESIAAAFPEHEVFLHLFNGTLDDMIDFCPQVDILASPHGSQLTGIMFMQKCSAVLEMFPHLYYTPYYFSSMARMFQLPHANWYISNDALPATPMLDLQTRLANSNNNMCPSTDKLVSAVKELIRKRQDCLDSI